MSSEDRSAIGLNGWVWYVCTRCEREQQGPVPPRPCPTCDSTDRLVTWSAWAEKPYGPTHEADCALGVNMRHGCTCGAEKEGSAR